jgi:hypothetical protein
MLKSFAFRLVLLVNLSLFSVFSGFAQRVDVQEWPKGRIVLTNGDTLNGPLTFHRTEDIIRITVADGSIQAFAPVNVTSFTVTDSRSRVSQTFRPYPWNRDNDYSDFKAPAFFEVVSDGKYTLVKREILATRSQNYSPMYAGGYGGYYDPYGYNYGGPRYQTVVQDLFYLYTPKGEIKALRNPKRDLEDLFQEKARHMKDFVRKNRLEYDNARDLAIILSHFNSLN